MSSSQKAFCYCFELSILSIILKRPLYVYSCVVSPLGAQHISSPVHTVCVGHAESMAAILLSAGEPGQRRAMPHSRVMVHQPSLGVNRATAADVMIQVGRGALGRMHLDLQ